jgi:hypothetical protein
MKTKSIGMMVCGTLALAGCGGTSEPVEQERDTGVAQQPLSACETVTYDMLSPIQYTPPSGYTIQSVSGSGTWNAHDRYTQYRDLACPSLGDAVGYSTTYTRNFDNYYPDNSGSCTYTFCSYMPAQCGQQTVTFSPTQAMSYGVPFGTIQRVVFNGGSWNAYESYSAYSYLDPQACRSLSNWVGSSYIAQEFDNIYNDNSGPGCTYTIYYGTDSSCAP